MTVTAEPPTGYVARDGRRAVVQPTDGWITLGVAPVPGPSTWDAFRYHLFHGLLMRYPTADVLAFAWRHRNDNWWQPTPRS